LLDDILHVGAVALMGGHKGGGIPDQQAAYPEGQEQLLVSIDGDRIGSFDSE